MRQCEILINGVKAGLLTESDDGKYTFVYDQAYSKIADAEAVSATMPVRDQPYESDFLFPVFFNMLTEGANREVQSRLFAKDIHDDFGIMLESCRTDTIGAITVNPLKK